MPSLGKFSAWIEVDDEHLPEFESTLSDDTQTITCWVPSEAGKEFAVCWKDPNITHPLDGLVWVDGNGVGGRCHRFFKPGTEITVRKELVQTSNTSGRALAFSTIELTDDDTYLKERPSVESIGEIKLNLYEAEVLGEDSSATFSLEGLSATEKLHERSKKGLGHRVGLGREIKPKGKNLNVRRIRVLATFLFRCRPLAILQANGIAPIDESNKRKASTPPQESSDEEDKETLAQIEDLQKKLRDLEKQRKKKRVKTEVKTEPVSVLRPPKHLGVIDLTDD